MAFKLACKIPVWPAIDASVSQLMVHMLDPRGRCNRKGLLIVAVLLLAAEVLVGAMLWLAGAALDGGAVITFKTICVWFAICAGSKRLHDLNLSAWWMLGTLAVTTLWTLALVVALFVTVGDGAMLPGSGWYMLALAGSATPILAATLWLHFRKGESGLNRFGSEPQGLGFSGPEISFQPLAEAVHRLQRMLGPQTA